ncbi:type III polyketide synthase [Methylopila sp. Yamaguchi]|uniref:type III polyketide synthase n=1 Tax=Methylopila sp. Yamaguchi TaxID=1437817 RepID=UPI000CCC175A|nr:type III polyketide synthase [Methylopila sp. Yamaguchi]
MTTAYLNRIATAVPANDVHAAFVAFARSLLRDPRANRVFQRMAGRSQIEHRWSSLTPAYDAPDGAIDQEGFYAYGRFPSTAARMTRYEKAAPDLAALAVERLNLGPEASRITHLIVVSCTGVSAPGLDFDLVARFGLKTSVERTVVAFMGCYAAINGLKLARHIVRSEPDARVLLVCLELCTLHLKETQDLEQILTFSVFGDGCAAALVSSEATGLALESFHAALAPGTADQISWKIRDHGFDMVLSGAAPGEIGRTLRGGLVDVLAGRRSEDVDLWAVHPGGRSVLDAVETALELPSEALAASRNVLRANGNMSSATILFVLQEMMRDAEPGLTGCAMAFGPGLVAETMMFRTADG